VRVVTATAGDVVATAGNVSATVGNVSGGHFIGTDSAPSWATGAALGGDPPALLTGGTDSAGFVEFTTDTAGSGSHTDPPLAGGNIAVMTFSRAYSSAPVAVLFAAEDSSGDMASSLSVPDGFFGPAVSCSTTAMTIKVDNQSWLNAQPGVKFRYNYVVIG
jgi:hypothetical protein